MACFRYGDVEQRWCVDTEAQDPIDIAASAMQRVVAAIEGRQRLIRMADRSVLGWRVVQHYVADALADDAADRKE